MENNEFGEIRTKPSQLDFGIPSRLNHNNDNKSGNSHSEALLSSRGNIKMVQENIEHFVLCVDEEDVHICCKYYTDKIQ